MTVTVFVSILMLISTLTSLFTEGIKKLLDVKNPYIVALGVSVALSVIIGVTYPIMFDVAYSAQFIVSMVWECLLGCLCALVGYDKVIEALKKIGEK